MKKFDIPAFYRSPIIGRLKEARRIKDPRKKDISPSVIDLGPIRFHIARHFGFCYGVENAIEISYKALEENPGKRIFLLSQMIHNPEVNNDLRSRGIEFIMDTKGKQFIEWSELKPEDIVIIPAFGTTLEIEQKLADLGIETQTYNTTCPFVERVWKRSEKLGASDHTIVIHGKNDHEETRATFSHSNKNAPSVVVRDMEETRLLGRIMSGEEPISSFETHFGDRSSEGFDPKKDLGRIGVVNQTTMLATETQEIADHLKQVMLDKHGADSLKEHFADTRDTLCYATNDNQQATYALLEKAADLAIVVGGYNSSNTSHIVELCETHFPTYFINSADELLSATEVQHFDIHKEERTKTSAYLPKKEVIDVVVTSGASCPDTAVDQVLLKLMSFYQNVGNIEDAIKGLVTDDQAV